MSTIQGKDAILKISADGTTYKEIVCEVSHAFKRSRSTNSIETKCYGGVAYISVGALSGSIDFTGVFETQPGTTQVGANDMLDYLENATYLYFKLEVPTGGADRYRQGRCYVTSFDEDAKVGDVMQFNFTLTIDGAVGTTP